jgi:hypothetical protein
MSWMVVYEYEVPEGALNPSLLNYPDHGHLGNRTRDLMISSQKLCLLDHEAGLYKQYRLRHFLQLITAH